MYYILVDKQKLDERRVFPNAQTLPEPDGRAIISVSDLRFTRFSYGQVELINDTDLATLQGSIKSSSSSKAKEAEE